MRALRTAAALGAVASVCLLPAAGAAEPSKPGIRLPAPVHGVDPLAGVDLGLRPDRLKTSQVPGTVRNREAVTVAVGPTGAPAAVTDEQHLVIRGAGNYVVRELGPAREAVGLGGTVPPVLELGTVVWQGFSPGRRVLAARLSLDPGIEAARLPMRIGLSFAGADGGRAPLLPGGVAPADGTVTVRLTNATTSARVLPTGLPRPAAAAAVLDRLRRAAARPRPAVPPVASSGLPAVVPGRTTGRREVDVVAPLRVTGTITAPGGPAAVSGPGLSPVRGGAAVAGTLSGAATFTVRVGAGERVGFRFDVRPWLDPRTLAPPAPARTWAAWAARPRSARTLAAAGDTMVAGAAAAARAAEYSPYLQADAPGPALSSFTYVAAQPAAERRSAEGLTPRPGAIAAAAVALLAVLGNAELLRRRV